MRTNDSNAAGGKNGEGLSSPRRFVTTSGREIEQVYRPSDTDGIDYDSDLADPGTYPFTRGIHPTGYRGKMWTMRMFAGFGSADETNARFRYLLSQGQS